MPITSPCCSSSVDVLKVKHIMVVGHYGCGGVSAAVDGKRRGLVDHWLHPIRELYQEHRRALERIPICRPVSTACASSTSSNRCETLRPTSSSRRPGRRGQDISVHGWVYSLANGLVTDLDVTVSRPEMIEGLD